MKKFLPFSFAFLILLGISCSTEEPKPTYNLSLSITPAEGGKVTVSPQSLKYQEGEVITLTPEPNENWVFDSWGLDLSGIETPKTLLMNSDKNVEVKFKRKATVSSLNCNSATNNGTLTSGVTIQGGINSLIPYEGGSGGSHNGQIVSSTGNTGLTATLNSGTFAIGNGTLNYIITGTPSNSGIASFELNIGGKTCTLNRLISPSQTTTLIVDVKSPITGRTWMDRNLGASRAATSRTDAASFGYLYQWGRGTDGHQERNSSTTTTLSNTDLPGNGNFILTLTLNFNRDWRSPQNHNLWQGVNGVNNPCPSGYRLPTGAEWQAEAQGWTGSNETAAFNSFLKLPLAGGRSSNNVNGLISEGEGLYWSRTTNASSAIYVITKKYNSANFRESGNRGLGFSVRCIKD